jgi:ribosomal protein S25
LPIGASVFCLSALIYYHVQYEVVQVRSAMQVVVAAIYQAIGFAPAVMFFLLLLTWSSIWFVTGRLERPLVRTGRLLAMAVMLGVFLNLGDGGVSAAVHKGAVGAWFAGCLVAAIGYYPSIVLVWAVTFASLLLATDFFFSDSFEKLRLRPRPESGVETAVTDHLRGLAGTPAAEPLPRVVPPSPDAVDAALAAAPELDFLRELPADETAADESERRFETRRRRSYFDRRREERDLPEAPAEAAAESARDRVDVAAAAEWAAAHAVADQDQDEAADEVDLADAAEGDRAHGIEADEPVEVDASPEGARDVATGGEQAVPPQATAADGEEAAQRPPVPTFVPFEAEPTQQRSEQPAADEHDVFAEEDLADEAAADAFAEEDLADDEAGDDDVAEEDLAEERAATEADDDLLSIADATEPAAAAADEPEAEPEPEPEAARESLVAIPRPDHVASEHTAPTPPRVASRRDEPARRDDGAVRQQKLFAADVDEELLQEAIELVRGESRVTATLLRRRLRIDYQQAMDVLVQLGARGVVELEADMSQGRVVV